MPCEDISDILFQNRRSISLAVSRPPTVKPCASTIALTAPALDAVIPSNARRLSSRRRSSTPQVKAPWLPPPCNARLTVLVAGTSGTTLPLGFAARPDLAAAKKISGDQAKHDMLAEKQPMLEFTTPEHLGKLVLFLCSEGAETMTGAALSMDGGWVAQ